MDSARQNITTALQKTLQELGIDEKPNLSIPSSSEHGDFTTNIALVAFAKEKSDKRKVISSSPLDLANEIVDLLNTKYKILHTDRIEAIAPGFINFYLSKEYLLAQLSGIGVGTVNSLQKGKRFMVEFAHPNTHKAFHIGHLRNITTGESIVRLLKAAGADVIPVNYQGDVGMHIAKCLYGILQTQPFGSAQGKNSNGPPEASARGGKTQNLLEDVRKKSVHERTEFLGKAYAAGSSAFEENDPSTHSIDSGQAGSGQVSAKQEIKDLNALIYASAQRFAKEQGIDPGTTDYLTLVKLKNRTRLDEVYKLWKETRQWSLDYFESIYKRVYTHYDRYYFESECLAGVDRVKEAVSKGVLQESDGAIIFNGKPYGLHTRVFVNSLGLPTYEAKELALAQKEISEFGTLDKIIHVVGPEQASFFTVTFKAEELLGMQKDQQLHVVYGWVKLKHGKMSSRSGNVVLGEWLLDEAKTQIKEQFPDMEEETLEKVAVGAVKYSMLKFGLTSEISFSFEESISLEGNSGPYLQYAYARTQSILRKGGNVILSETKDPRLDAPVSTQDARQMDSSAKPQNDMNEEELALLRLLNRFPTIIEEAAEQFAPNMLCTYLFEVAQKFNLFYQKHKILESEQKDFRIALTQGVGAVLKEGLSLLGIQAPDRM